eukprot:scaffold129773_cov42-Phaeocystis_antarctica.AAC.1
MALADALSRSMKSQKANLSRVRVRGRLRVRVQGEGRSIESRGCKHVAVAEPLALERAELGEAEPDEREHARVRRHLQRRAQRAVAVGQARRLGRERRLKVELPLLSLFLLAEARARVREHPPPPTRARDRKKRPREVLLGRLRRGPTTAQGR